jgi:hypothetical protein
MTATLVDKPYIPVWVKNTRAFRRAYKRIKAEAAEQGMYTNEYLEKVLVEHVEKVKEESRG